ncbi:MAG: hypothetical protein K6F68_03875 [Clostridiales bacterium]|nr:hypothetical protein [Clostridiales bacterium]
MILFFALCFLYDLLYLVHSAKAGRASSAVFAGLLALASAALAVLSLV